MAEVSPHLMILLAKPHGAAAGGEMSSFAPPVHPSSMADGGEAGDEKGLSAFADDLISAVHSKDSAGVVEAFQNMFDACEMAPHDEGGEPEDEEAEDEEAEDGE